MPMGETVSFHKESSSFVMLYLLGALKRSLFRYIFSLLKVHLQLRGFTVFLDIEKLAAGRFDDRLLNSVKQAKNFILVLTPGALERCIHDDLNKDWVHRVSTPPRQLLLYFDAVSF